MTVTASNFVDKTALVTLIYEANVKVANAQIGTEVGQYPQSAVGDFLAAITLAQAVVINVNATQAQVNKAIEDLEAAEAIFDASVIGLEEALSISVEDDGSIKITSNYGDVVSGTRVATINSGGSTTNWVDLGDKLQIRVTTRFPVNMTNILFTPNEETNTITISGAKQRFRTMATTTLTVVIRDKSNTDISKSFTVEVSGSRNTGRLTIGEIIVLD